MLPSSLIVLSILAAKGHLNELKAHTKGALNNGLTEEEIRSVLGVEYRVAAYISSKCVGR